MEKYDYILYCSTENKSNELIKRIIGLSEKSNNPIVVLSNDFKVIHECIAKVDHSIEVEYLLYNLYRKTLERVTERKEVPLMKNLDNYTDGVQFSEVILSLKTLMSEPFFKKLLSKQTSSDDTVISTEFGKIGNITSLDSIHGETLFISFN